MEKLQQKVIVFQVPDWEYFLVTESLIVVGSLQEKSQLGWVEITRIDESLHDPESSISVAHVHKATPLALGQTRNLERGNEQTSVGSEAL